MFGWGKKRDSLSLDQWAPIAPSAPGSSGGRFGNILKPSKGGARSLGPTVGRWPESVLLRIADYLPVADLPAFARVNRGFSRVVRDERGWEGRCGYLRIGPDSKGTGMDPVNLTPQKKAPTPAKSPLKKAQRKDSLDDDFGDFSNNTADGFEDVDFGDMHIASPRLGSHANGNGNGQPNNGSAPRQEANLLDFGDLPLPSNAAHSSANKRSHGFFALPAAVPVARMTSSSPGPYYLAYRAHHLSLLPLCRHLRTSTSPSSTLALLFPPDPATSLPLPLPKQAERLLTLLLFLSPRLQPLRDWGFLRQALLSAADRFDSTCLVAFEMGDSKKDERAMRIAADGSWKVFEVSGGRRDQWECGRVWVEKREVFYETGKWDAGENIQRVTTSAGQNIRQLDFTPMDAFVAHVLETFRQDAETAVRVFPAQAGVVLSFCDRVVTDVIGEYINSLLSSARNISPHLFLQATPAAFVQAWKVVDVASSVLSLQSNGSPASAATTASARTDIEETVFRMFADHLDEYLDEETDTIKVILEGVCSTWDKHLGEDTSTAAGRSRAEGPTFLSSQNPDQMKRNVLAGFKDVLLLPVTIVPRTVSFGVNALVAGSNTAVSGLAMLNPQKWAGNTGARVIKEGNQEVVFDIPSEIKEVKEKEAGEVNEKRLSASSVGSNAATPMPGTPRPDQAGSIRTRQSGEDTFDRLQLLVSLDTALELIQADRDSLKRCETFAKYPAKNGIKVREAIEEIFILLLKAVGDRHIAPGFRVATSQMMTYKPADHESSTSVAPLLQFFELVHVGDTIQSMVQVYFDKELATYVDKTDFLNAVMREKKRFEGILDDAVAGGLNAGIEVLMNQVEHIIITKTAPREYCPDEGTPLELGPTAGCQEAIKCLEMHCDLLRGSTSKEVLEVFYQEVGIRLQQILQRHLKRQIISLEGGFQIIADLNAYHAFVASLKQQAVTEDFSNLKMLGHVYIVSDAKDLAQIVRDVTRYGGGFRPEDIYEFIQRRADWKKIEKTVDKAMYALSVKDDCVVM